MKVKSKNELREQIASLEKLNADLTEKLEAEEKRQWEAKIPVAVGVALRKLNEVFPYMLTNLRCEHIDKAGYWFSFQLRNDERVQRHCVRHDEVDGHPKCKKLKGENEDGI